MSKIIRIEEGIETYEERKKFFEDASIYLPSTLKNIGSLCFASYEEEVKFEVVYNGTKEDFLKIKKGRMVFTEVKDDFYGDYYHNTPSSSSTEKRYFNWISFCNPVLIHCLIVLFTMTKRRILRIITKVIMNRSILNIF